MISLDPPRRRGGVTANGVPRAKRIAGSPRKDWRRRARRRSLRRDWRAAARGPRNCLVLFPKCEFQEDAGAMANDAKRMFDDCCPKCVGLLHSASSSAGSRRCASRRLSSNDRARSVASRSARPRPDFARMAAASFVAAIRARCLRARRRFMISLVCPPKILTKKSSTNWDRTLALLAKGVDRDDLGFASLRLCRGTLGLCRFACFLGLLRHPGFRQRRGLDRGFQNA